MTSAGFDLFALDLIMPHFLYWHEELRVRESLISTTFEKEVNPFVWHDRKYPRPEEELEPSLLDSGSAIELNAIFSIAISAPTQSRSRSKKSTLFETLFGMIEKRKRRN